MTASTRSDLRLVTFDDPAASLGVAVRLTMRHRVFASMSFGEWAGVLAAQAARGHQAFVVDDAKEVRGFFGYAFASRGDAEAWANGRRLSSDECLRGDCLILNALVSSDRQTLMFLVRALRRLGRHKQALYFKRHYGDGSVRAACLANSEIVARHLKHDSDGTQMSYHCGSETFNVAGYR